LSDFRCSPYHSSDIDIGLQSILSEYGTYQYDNPIACINSSTTLCGTSVREYNSSIFSSEFSSFKPPSSGEFHNIATFQADIHNSLRKKWLDTMQSIAKSLATLTMAMKQHFKSNIEFGACIFDYPGLKDRYLRIRRLELEEEVAADTAIDQAVSLERVRFVNYYTMSTGISKSFQFHLPSSEEPQRYEVNHHPPERNRPVDDKTLPKNTRTRKFCTLPPRINGRQDLAWIGVHVESADEVRAHCELFSGGEHYEMFIGDVGERIDGWIKQSEMRRRMQAS